MSLKWAGLLIVVMTGMVFLLGGAAQADDVTKSENLFADLIPGTELTEAELGNYHGRGASSTTSSGGNDTIIFGMMDTTSDMRRMISRATRAAGVDAPMVPAAGTDTTPRLPTASVPRISIPSTPTIDSRFRGSDEFASRSF